MSLISFGLFWVSGVYLIVAKHLWDNGSKVFALVFMLILAITFVGGIVAF